MRSHEDVLMTGYSGTSRHGNLHSYYKCKNTYKKNCDKKNVKKKYIEDLIVDYAREQLTDENLEIILSEAEKFYAPEKGNNNLARLKKQLRECENAINNLLKALEQGQAADIITAQLAKRQSEVQELKNQIAKEELSNSEFDIDKVKFFLYSLKDGNINDIKYRKALVNLFINRVYLFDDRMTLLFNTSKAPTEITVDILDEIGLDGGSFEVGEAPVETP